jgi:signal transduction histidine kinase/CheY-like chemotaxis protein
MEASIYSIYLPNKSVNLSALHHSTHRLKKNAYFSSLQAVQWDPSNTYNTYYFLLDSIHPIKQKDIYLPAYHTAIDNNCPVIKESHHQKAKDIILHYLDSPHVLNHFSFCVFLAKALISDKAIWIREKEIPDTESIAFDVLLQAEHLFDCENLKDIFLGAHAYEEYLQLTAQDWYLHYRYPEKTYQEKFDIQLNQFRKLEQLYPLCLNKENIRQVTMDFAIKEFIASLNSGRIVSNKSVTLQRSKPDILAILEPYQQRQTRFTERLNRHQELLEANKKEYVGNISEKIQLHVTNFSGTNYLKFDNDLSEIFDKLETREEYTKKIEIIFSQHGISEECNEIDNDMTTFIQKYTSSFQDYQHSIDNIKQDIQRDHFKTGMEIFEIIKQHHVMHGSEMFESFRKRIRHGWLIASLKDCFSRFGLYMDSETETISPTMQEILNQLTHSQAIEDIQQMLTALTTAFNDIARKLNTEILLIKDHAHPNGLLDYSNDHFPLKQWIESAIFENEMTPANIHHLIEKSCKLLDKRSLQCFETIKSYLEGSVFQPLNNQLMHLQKTINKWKHVFDHLTMERDQLLANVESAQIEFKQNIEDYKSWFGFYQSAVRDFTLPEIILAAEKLVGNINFTQIQKKNILPAKTHFAEGLENMYVVGNNFSELIELFKILFQNVTFHAISSQADNSIFILIDVDIVPLSDEKFRCIIEFVSTHSQWVDTDQLTTIIRDPQLREVARQGEKGTGLATIEDILQERLIGISGSIDKLIYDNNNDTFSVKFHMDINEFGVPVKPTTVEMQQSVPYEVLVSKVSKIKSLKILIVEDQPHKFDALRDYVLSILSDSHITHAWDMETSCRLLLNTTISFDMVIMDMTLPVDPCFDANLDSLAGLTILKIMAHNKSHIPTILVTQYTNWQTETSSNTRIYLDHLDKFCFHHYGSFYKGSIRFSHTERSWQKKLADIIFSMSDNASHYEKKGDLSKAILFYEKKRQREPDNIQLLMKLAHAYYQTKRYADAINCYTKALNDDNSLQEALSCLSLIYAELGDINNSDKYFKKLQNINHCASDTLHKKILDAQIKSITSKRQELYQTEMMNTLGQMASGMAHEFSTPLLAIKTISQVSTHFIKKGKIDKNKIIEDFDTIVDYINKMNAHVKHIQALAKENQIKREKTDVNTVIQSALKFFDEQLKNRSIYVIKTFSDNLPPVLANPYRLEQVFINLIQNSRDAFENIQGRKKEIHITTRLIRGETWTTNIQFKDNGQGISPEIREQLFEPFKTTKEIGKGIGLGLSIVKGIITEYNGTIKAHSEPDMGTNFSIELPVSQGLINK